MRCSRIMIVALAFALAGYAAGAAPAGKGPELVFDPPEGAQSFEDGKAAFLEKKYDAASEQLGKARKAAKNKEAQKEVERWLAGVKGLGELLMLEKHLDKQPGWVYENAQRKYLVYIATPAAELFRKVLQDIENSERKIVVKFESFEDTARAYNAKYGRTYINKAREPEHVVDGSQSLKWECKNEASRALKIVDERVPKDWSQYDYLGFWMYGVAGFTTRVELCVTNERSEAPKEGKARGAKVTFDGYQAAIPPHEGWRFITLSLKEGLKGSGILQRIGAGDLKRVGSMQFQLQTAKKFATYLDCFVLIKSK